MVRQVEGSAAERRLNQAMAWIPPALRSYAISLFALILVTVAAYPILHYMPRGSRGLPGLIFGLLYILILLGSSWLGYGAGILTWTLIIFVLPPIIGTGTAQRTQTFDPVRFGLLLLVSVLISALAASLRRREAELVKAADDLERRVEERTQEATQAAREARENAREPARTGAVARPGARRASSPWIGTVPFASGIAARRHVWLDARRGIGKDLARASAEPSFQSPLSGIEDNVATHRDAGRAN